MHASQSRLTTGVASGSAGLEIIAGASRGFYLRELSFSLAAATASVYGLGRPAAKGTTPTAPVSFPFEQSGDPSTLQAATALAWAGAPTAPTVFYRQTALAAAIGSWEHWQLDQLFVPAGGSIVLWNLALNSAAYVNIIIDEF